MDLNQLDTRVATREAGTTARGATRPWGFGNIAPGPCLPHGSAHPGPNTDRGRSNGYAPTRPIRGFAQIHVSGTGSSGKYGNVLLVPQLGLAIGEEAHDSPKADEIATPAYYAVTLTRYGIRVELTATHCCALHRITFPQSREACLAFDLAHNIPGDATRREGWPVAGHAAWQADGRRLAGSGRYHGGWGRDLEIRRHGDGACIGSAYWNGQPLDRCWVRHGEIAAGGVLEFQMSEQAGAWGRSRLPGGAA